jgi:hypothetical protein
VLWPGGCRKRKAEQEEEEEEEEEAGDDALQDGGTPSENGPLVDGPTLGQRLEALQLRAQRVLHNVTMAVIVFSGTLLCVGMAMSGGFVVSLITHGSTLRVGLGPLILL